MKIVLDFRPFGDREADAGEEGFDTRRGAAERMAAPGLLAAARQGNIKSFTAEAGIQRGLFQDGPARSQRRFQELLGLVDRLAGAASLLG